MAVFTENGTNTPNGSHLEFTYTFPTIKTDGTDVKVSLNGVTQATNKYTVTTTSPTKITFNNTSVDATVQESTGAPKTGVLVRVYRDTIVDAAEAVYAAGSSIRAKDLNANQDQILFALQEEAYTANIANLAVTAGKIPDDTLDSQHYIAGSIDLEHMSANSVDSDQYVDGSIDLIHLSANSVDSSKIVDGSIVNADINASAAIAKSKLDISDVTTSAAGYMSAADKTKLDGIETGATADQTNAEIRTAVEAATDSNVFTDADHTKLDGIAAGAEVNVQSDWNASSGDAQILNKPTIPTNIGDLANVHNTTPSDGQVLKWVNSNSRWEPGTDAGGGGGSGEANQNAFSVIAVSGQNNVESDTATDTLNLAAGSNITLTTNATTDTVTIAASGGEVTVQDEGSSLSTAATTLNFVGSGVTASGTGATKTITIAGGGGANSTDFKYLELKAHNNASGAFSAGAASYELVTKGTTTALTPSQAAALIISIGGVIQEPNTGTSIGSNTGFCIDGSSIHFGANLAAHPDFILYLQGAGVATIGDNTVTGAKIALGSDAAGDIMYYNGTDYARLAVGSAGQMLQVNSGANAPEWTAAPSGTTNLSNTANGTSLTVESSSGNNTALPAATTSAWGVMTDEDKTKLDGIATGATATPTTTRGDIIYRGASADTRLAKGTAGQYLKIGANDPEWADVVGAVADGCIFENDQTISNNYTIAAGKGAHSVGPITVNATVTVNGNWVVS